MGTIKDRNGMDLTEAEDIKKRWQEHTEELYKKDLHDPDNHDGVITNLESIFKSRDSILPTNVPVIKAMVFSVVMHGCESWTVKNAER